MNSYVATIIAAAGKDEQGELLVRDIGFIIVRAKDHVDARNRAGRVATAAALLFSYMDIQPYGGNATWPGDFNRFIKLKEDRHALD